MVPLEQWRCHPTDLSESPQITELIERPIDSWALHSTRQITGATLVYSRVPKVTWRERKGRTVPSRLRMWVTENYSIINTRENRQGAEKLDIHPSRALGRTAVG